VRLKTRGQFIRLFSQRFSTVHNLLFSCNQIKRELGSLNVTASTTTHLAPTLILIPTSQLPPTPLPKPLETSSPAHETDIPKTSTSTPRDTLRRRRRANNDFRIPHTLSLPISRARVDKPRSQHRSTAPDALGSALQTAKRTGPYR